MKTRLGIFGGTFDPPHLGHLILAAEAHAQLDLDRVLWVLTPDPPHKQGHFISAMDRRLTLVEAAIADNPAFELSRVDIDRPGPQFSVDTVRIIQKENPGVEVDYLIGGDSLRDLPVWNRPRELVHEVPVFGVMRRPKDEVDLGSLEAVLPGLSAKIRWIDAPLLEISSSELRQRIYTGKPYRYYLPERVYTLIRSERYYQELSDVNPS